MRRISIFLALLLAILAVVGTDGATAHDIEESIASNVEAFMVLSAGPNAYVALEVEQTATATSATAASLDNATANDYQAWEATVIGTGDYTYGNGQAASPSLPTPTGLTITTTASSASLDWDDTPGATSYIYRYRKSAERKWSNDTKVSVSEAQVEELENGTDYAFQVQAKNDADTSQPVTGTATTNPATPEGVIQVAGTADSLNFDWGDVPGATAYIYRYRKQGATAWVAEQTVNASSVALTGLEAGAKFQVQVKSSNSGGNSEYTESVPGLTAPGVLTGLARSAVSHNSAILDWDDAPGATGYKYQVKLASEPEWGPLIPVRDVWTSTVEVSALNDLTAYDFRVLATNSTGDSGWVETGFTTAVAIPDAPTGFAVASVSGTSVTLTWDGVDKATAYEYQYREQSAVDEEGQPAWEEPVEVSEPSVTIGELTTGTVYEFQVRAMNSSGRSLPPPTVTETTADSLPPVPTGLKVTDIAETEVTLDWPDTPDAESYTYQYRETGTSEWGEEVEVSESTAVVKNLTKDTQYDFRVSAKNAFGQSQFSESVSDTPRYISPFAVGEGLWGKFRDDEEDPHFYKGDTMWVIGVLIFALIVGGGTKNVLVGLGSLIGGLAVSAIIIAAITPLIIFFLLLSAGGVGVTLFLIGRG